MGASFWQSPEFVGGIVPFVIALALSALLRVGGGRRGAWIVPLAIGVAWLAAYWMLEGIAWSPVASKQKVFYLALLAIVAGLLLDAARVHHKVLVIASILFPVFSLGWLAWRPLTAGPGADLLLTLALLWATSIFVFWRLAAAGRSDGDTSADTRGLVASQSGLNSPSLLFIAAMAAGAISFLGAYIGMSQLSIAMGAALGGYLLVLFVLHGATGNTVRFGALGVIGAGGAWLAAMHAMFLYGQNVSKIAGAVLLLSFLADPLARKVQLPSAAGHARWINPILYGGVTAIPALTAVVLAVLLQPEPSGY